MRMSRRNGRQRTPVDRLDEDLKTLQIDRCPMYRVVNRPNERQWTVAVQGPVGCPYEYRSLLVHLLFPEDYPASGPTVVMGRDIFHPNVHPQTKVMHVGIVTAGCWQPCHDARAVILSVLDALVEPSDAPDLVVNPEAKIAFRDQYVHKMLVDAKLDKQ